MKQARPCVLPTLMLLLASTALVARPAEAMFDDFSRMDWFGNDEPAGPADGPSTTSGKFIEPEMGPRPMAPATEPRAPAPRPPVPSAAPQASFAKAASLPPLVLSTIAHELTEEDEGPARAVGPITNLTPAQMDAQKNDCTTLQSLYTALDGPKWAMANGWRDEPASDCCTWHRVFCNTNGRVREIRLPNNNLKGPIPEVISSLTALTHLDLAGNDITGELPKALTLLTSLSTLNLDDNKLSGSLPDDIGKMAGLKIIHMKSNSISGDIPSSIGSLPKLQGLYLSENKLSGSIPSSIGNLPNLQAITLDHNQLSGEIPESIGSLLKLQVFSARDNALSGCIPESISKLSALSDLALGKNQITGTITSSLMALSNLAILDLSNNQITGPIPENIGSLAKLQRLVLKKNDLSGPIPASISKLSALEWLMVEGNRLNGTFPNIAAPSRLGMCKVQPNRFSGCPSREAQSERTSLAFTCQIDCSPKHLAPREDGTSGAAQLTATMSLIAAGGALSAFTLL